MNFAQVVSAVNLSNSSTPVPVKAACLMAFQITCTLKEGETEAEVVKQTLYPGKPVVYNTKRHFLASASRDAMDRTGHRYGYITFSARGSEERKAMKAIIEQKQEEGVILKGERFLPVYSLVDGDDVTMLLVSTARKIQTRSGMRNVRSLSDLDIFLSSDPKAGKRARRYFANYKLSIDGIEVGKREVPTGTVYDCLLDDGRTITILNYNMSLLSAEQTSVVDGSMIIRLPEFDGVTATVQGSFGQGKGIGYDVPGTEYDIVIYGSKKEIANTDGRIFIGALNYIHKGELFTDLQTVTNMGSYDDDLLVDMTIRCLNRHAEALMDGDEAGIQAMMAPQARAMDAAFTKSGGNQPKWAVIQGLEYGIGTRVFPWLFRRVFRTVFENVISIKDGKCSIPMEGGMRGYVRWNPAMGSADGTPILDQDYLAKLTINGLPVVCIPDAPEGEILLARNPNTHPGEFILVWNDHGVTLMFFKGEGWIFLGANAGEIMGVLNDGDMDDSCMVIWNVAFIAKWKTMKYPVQPKLEVPKSLPMNEARAARIARMKGFRDQWNWNIFKQDLEDYTGFSQSLGGFIVKGWIEMLLSGEHRQAILESIDTGTFLMPNSFVPPSQPALKDMLSADMKHLANDYEPSEEAFLAVCRKFAETKADYRGNRAMSNSFIIIDWDVMKKGDKKQVTELHAEAAELVKTPIFPMCFERRIPRARKLAGDYILVETKLCRALAKIEARYNEILEEAKEMEALITRPMPQQVLETYAWDDQVLDTVERLRGWWIKALAAQKDEGGHLAEGAYDKVASGYMALNIETGKTVRQPGLIDFYAYQHEPQKDGSLKLTDRRFSPEMRRKIVIHWLNMQYENQKTSDGVPDFMLTDLLMAFKETGLAGRVVFADLNQEGRKYADRIAPGDFLEVVCYGGIVYHGRNNRQLTDSPNAYLFDGGYAMSSAGVITVKFADPELQSGFKEELRAETAQGTFREDAGDMFAD